MSWLQNLLFEIVFLIFAVSNASASALCNVKDFGAVGDGKTKDTIAIQSAIDVCAKTGGKVVLRDGVFLTGMIRLKSNITFYVDDTARLKGSWKDSDYPLIRPKSENTQLEYLQKALIYAEKAKNITIEGSGTIDGNGDKLGWRLPWIHERERPMAIFIVQSKNVLIQDVHIKDSAMWTLVTLESDDVVIRGVRIDSSQIPNRDGIDIVDGRNILIENNTILSQDDSICLKSGSKYGLENVIVRNNKIIASTFANGLKMGTASVGSFKNILFENIEIEKVNLAAMAVESIDGAKIENIVFKNINVKRAGTPFFIILGSRKGNTRPIGSIDGVHFKNIQVERTSKTWGSPISGTINNGVRYAPKNISFEDIQVTFRANRGLDEIPEAPPEYDGRYPDPNMWGQLPAAGIYLRHIDRFSMKNTDFNLWGKDIRPLLTKEL